MTQKISLPDLEIEDAPTAEQIENFRRENVNRFSHGKYVDKHFIANAPTNKHYEWQPDTPENIDRLTSLGFKVDDALGGMSPHITSSVDGAKRIGDVRCFSIHKDYHNARLDAFEIAKSIKQDPRKSYEDAAKEVSKALGSDFRHLPESEIAGNTKNTIGFDALQLEIMKDQKSKPQT
jgi:hypothetical protein